MSSPIRDDFALRAAGARARAQRSRLMLWGAGAIGLGLIVVFVFQSFNRTVVMVTAPSPVVEKTKAIAGGASNFAGVDEYSRPFTVQSQDGTQDANDESLMHLRGVTGTFVRRGGGEVKIKSDSAEYHIKNKNLRVTGNVVFEEPGRYVAQMKSAEVNLERQRMTTNQPVQVQTSGATVSADSMETSEDGSVIKMAGHVVAHFTNAGMDE